MFCVFLGLSIYYFIKEGMSIKYPILVFLIGLLIGVILSRIQNLSWDKNSKQIIKEFDIISGILLFFLILLIIFKRNIVNEFIHLPKITAIIFALNAGIMFGKTIQIRRQIASILKKHKPTSQH